MQGSDLSRIMRLLLHLLLLRLLLQLHLPCHQGARHL